MRLDEMLQRTNRHVAILGAFNLDRNEPKVLRGSASDVLRQLKFSVMSERTLAHMNGEGQFNTYAVASPADLLGVTLGVPPSRGREVDIERMVVLPDGDGVLAQNLANGSNGAGRNIGVKLLAQLLDAADDLRPFEHPAFGIQLTEGIYFAWDSRGLPLELVDAATLRKILYHPAFNLALLDYLRANARRDENGEMKSALVDAARTALGEILLDLSEQAKERLAQAFANEAAAYRTWLVTPPQANNSGNREEAYFAVLEKAEGRGREFQTIRSNHPIPEHSTGGLRENYVWFRKAHDQMADLAQCEPLMAFITRWYLESFSENQDGHALAEAIFEAIYKNNPEAQPSGIPQRVKEEADQAHATALKSLLKTTSEKPQDTVAKDIANSVREEHRNVRRPQAGFERDELIDLMCEELKSLSLKLIPGRETLESSTKKLVKAYRKAELAVERCFRVTRDDNDSERFRTEMEPYFETLGAEVGAEAGAEEGEKAKKILDAVLRKLGEGATPRAVADSLVVALGTAEGEVEAVMIDRFRAKEGKEIDERGDAVRGAYEQLLSHSGRLKVAGSLAPATNPRSSAEDVREAKVIAEMARLLKMKPGFVDVMPADKKEAEVLQEGQTATADAGAPGASKNDSSGKRGAREKPTAPPHADAPANDAGDGTAKAADRPSRAPQPISMALTAEEQAALLAEATCPNDRRPAAAALRRWAEILVDGGDEIIKEKSKIVNDNRVVAQTDTTGKRLAAGIRFLTLGEFFLAAPSANSPIGTPDTSFNAMLALYLMRHAGRAHGPRQRMELLQLWKQRNTDPEDLAARPDEATSDIREVPLWRICPALFDTDELDETQIANKFRETATESIAKFITQVRSQTDRLTKLSGFYSDVEEVKKLLRLLVSAGDCEVTVVNTIAHDYANVAALGAYPPGGPLFNGRIEDVHDTPPGMVFVSGQAFPSGAARDLDILTVPLGLAEGANREEPLRKTRNNAGNDSSWLCVNTHPGVFGVPVLIGAGVQSAELPVIGHDLPRLPELVALLTGGRVERLQPFCEAFGTQIAGGLPFNIGQYNPVIHALRTMLHSPTLHGPIITARVLTALAHQRQFGPFRQDGVRTLANSDNFDPTDTSPGLVQAVYAAIAALAQLQTQLGQKKLGELVFMRFNGAWNAFESRAPGAAGAPEDWIAFAPMPEPDASVAPNEIFNRLMN